MCLDIEKLRAACVEKWPARPAASAGLPLTMLRLKKSNDLSSSDLHMATFARDRKYVSIFDFNWLRLELPTPSRCVTFSQPQHILFPSTNELCSRCALTATLSRFIHTLRLVHSVVLLCMLAILQFDLSVQLQMPDLARDLSLIPGWLTDCSCSVWMSSGRGLPV